MELLPKSQITDGCRVAENPNRKYCKKYYNDFIEFRLFFQFIDKPEHH